MNKINHEPLALQLSQALDRGMRARHPEYYSNKNAGEVCNEERDRIALALSQTLDRGKRKRDLR